MTRRMADRGSIYDVARESGFSIGTVSRVFNNKPDVAEETRALVMEASKSVNYTPRISRRRVTIGLLVQELNKANEVGFVSNVISTLARQIALRGGVLELVQLDDIDAIYRNYVRGLIAVVFGSKNELLRSVRNIPVILINNQLDAPNVHCIASDHAQGAHLATRHLLERGHKRIGFIEVLRNAWGSRERQRGFRQAFMDAGLTPPLHLMRFCEEEPVADTLLPLLSEKPTALVVCGEDLSLEVNRLLIHDLGVKIPDDLSVISSEVSYVSSMLSPPQTTIAQPWEQLGSTAVDRMIRLIEKRPAKSWQRLLPNRLIERASVRKL